MSAPLTAILTTVDAKGRPQSTAVWYLMDSTGQLKASITSDRQKYKNPARNRNCSRFILDPQNPYRILEVRAEASLAADPEKVTVVEFAKHYNVDPAMLTSMGGERYTVVFPTSTNRRQPAGTELSCLGTMRRPKSNAIRSLSAEALS